MLHVLEPYFIEVFGDVQLYARTSCRVQVSAGPACEHTSLSPPPGIDQVFSSLDRVWEKRQTRNRALIHTRHSAPEANCTPAAV